MEEIDLYGGLDQGAPQEAYDDVLSRAEAAESESRTLRAQVDMLTKQNIKLSNAGLALKRNISCLYKTAKAETDRKAAEIARLRKEIEALKKQQNQRHHQQQQHRPRQPILGGRPRTTGARARSRSRSPTRGGRHSDRDRDRGSRDSRDRSRGAPRRRSPPATAHSSKAGRDVPGPPTHAVKGAEDEDGEEGRRRYSRTASSADQPW